MSNIHADELRPSAACAERRDLLFIGGFEHVPNVDGVLWFVHEILPLIQKKISGVRFNVVGSRAPAEIKRLHSDAILVHGFVPDVKPLFSTCRLSVAPLRFGAGVKGKVNQSLALGLPCVVTSVAAEGMHLTNGVDILIADDPSGFAQAVARVYEDDDLWQSLSQAGLENIAKHFSFSVAQDALEKLCGKTAE